MTRNQIALLLVFSFVLGCVVAPMANQFVVRPASAAPEGARKWEQYCSFQSVRHWPNKAEEYTDPTNADLKQRGLEGWELTSTTAVIGNGYTMGLSYCFKRPIQ